jgi:hypothetical protein
MIPEGLILHQLIHQLLVLQIRASSRSTVHSTWPIFRATVHIQGFVEAARARNYASVSRYTVRVSTSTT